MIYGTLPEDLGLLDLSPVEMMCWMYCPVMTPTSLLTLPPNLAQFRLLVERALDREGAGLDDKYVYLTVKTLWVAGDYIGNRPGWHSDGFGTDDVNYIWYDRAPTEFVEVAGGFDLPADCANAMELMGVAAEAGRIVTFPDKHLLRLTPSAVHRSPVDFAPGMRAFVKVSVSADRYNLEGNSINHGLAERWSLVPRKPERNHPVAA